MRGEAAQAVAWDGGESPVSRRETTLHKACTTRHRYTSPNPVTPYSIDLSVPRASSTVDLSLGIRHKVDLQPLMESRRNALEHGERMAVVVGVF
jgi:hypothetical protein